MVQGSPLTYVIEEHLIYVRELTCVWEKDSHSYQKVWSETKWLEVKDLKKGVHFIAMTENKNALNPHHLTKEEAWLIGRYMEDGYKQGELYRDNSISKELIYGLGQVVQKLYNTPYRIHFTEKPKTSMIEDRLVNHHDIWESRFRKEDTKRKVGEYIEGILA